MMSKRRKHLHDVSSRHLQRLSTKEAENICKNINACCTLSVNDCHSSLIIKDFSINETNQLHLQEPDHIKTTDSKFSSSVFTSNSVTNTEITCIQGQGHTEAIDAIQDDSSQDSLNGHPEFQESSVVYHHSGVNNLENKDPNINFREHLRLWALEEQITHSSLSRLLKLLLSDGHTELPSDARTLLKTPRETCVRTVDPGVYWHYGLANGIKYLIKNCVHIKVHDIQLVVNIDGLPLSKSSGSTLWPILVSVYPHNDVAVIGVYHGYAKPKCANIFMKDFIEELLLLHHSGIIFNDQNYKFQVKMLVCDAPAKSFILNTKGHGGYSSCPKCKIEGEYKERRVCFVECHAPKRTDADFVMKIDEEYHLGSTCLENIPNFGLVTNVPFDYMHLICLGIVRKLLNIWLSGSLKVRLSYGKVMCVSQKLEQFRPHVPVEFCRKPRSLECVKYWKATEFRQFLLYSGPVALQEVLPKNEYDNFVTLSMAIRILCSESYVSSCGEYAHKLLEHFVVSFGILYGEHNVSHNVHGVIHLFEDVLNFGVLDNFSAFHFENFMQRLKKLVRKSEKPLQQLSRRYAELASLTTVSSCVSCYPSVQHNSAHFDGPLPVSCTNPQYKIGMFNGFKLVAGSKSDGYCRMSDGEIVFIKNIAYSPQYDSFVAIGCDIREKQDLFQKPCPSSFLNIFKVQHLPNCFHCKLKVWPLSKVRGKCVFLPYRQKEFVVLPLVHCEKQ